MDQPNLDAISGRKTLIDYMNENQDSNMQRKLQQAHIETYKALAASGGLKGQTSALWNQLKQQYPNADPMFLLRLAQNKVGTNLTADPNTGTVDDMTGAAEGLGALAYECRAC